MDVDRAAQNHLDPSVHKTRLADQPLKLGRLGKAPDRFGKIAIAFFVLRDHLAHLRHDLVRIEIIDLFEARPARGRKLHAEKATARLQHAVRFLQSGGNIGDVTDAENDRVDIEHAGWIGELLRILARPHKAIKAALHRALDTHIKHVLIDISHGHVCAALCHAESDIACAASHIENGLAALRFHAPHKAVFP